MRGVWILGGSTVHSKKIHLTTCAPVDTNVRPLVRHMNIDCTNSDHCMNLKQCIPSRGNSFDVWTHRDYHLPRFAFCFSRRFSRFFWKGNIIRCHAFFSFFCWILYTFNLVLLIKIRYQSSISVQGSMQQLEWCYWTIFCEQVMHLDEWNFNIKSVGLIWTLAIRNFMGQAISWSIHDVSCLNVEISESIASK